MAGGGWLKDGDPVFRIHLAGDWRVGVGHNDAIKLLGESFQVNRIPLIFPSVP